jgi:hypothetical protein
MTKKTDLIKLGRPKKNEINRRFSLVITSNKLLTLLIEQANSERKDLSVLINERLLKSYENR